jgi:hypothetical protein
MSIFFSSLTVTSASLTLGSFVSSTAATTDPTSDQDIVLPASGSACNPLKWLGAHSPYFAGFQMRMDKRLISYKGPNVNEIDNTVPENCYVDQVTYVVRHGSRHPDSGAYEQWAALCERVRSRVLAQRSWLEGRG